MKKTRILILACTFAMGFSSTTLVKAETSDTKVARVQKTRVTQCAKPRGARVTIRSYFQVQDSSDGFSDSEVEAFGEVYFAGQRMWRIARNNAADANSGSRNKFFLPQYTYTVMFDDSGTWNLPVSGFLRDRDRSGGDDSMWNSSGATRMMNVMHLFHRYKQIWYSVEAIRGDGSSESADLFFQIVRSEDIF